MGATAANIPSPCMTIDSAHQVSFRVRNISGGLLVVFTADPPPPRPPQTKFKLPKIVRRPRAWSCIEVCDDGWGTVFACICRTC